MDVAQILADAFPVASELVRLELVEVSERDNGGIAVTVRLVVCERVDADTVLIRDIKEQEVWALSAAQRGDPRLAACVAGWAEALRHVFEEEDAHAADGVETLMPHELVIIGPLLTLKRPRTAEDFTDAALTGKQRLGRFLRS
jgi:hypothetical protein